MFKFISELVGVEKEELSWPSMQIVDHYTLAPRRRYWRTKTANCITESKEGIISNGQVDHTDPSFWRDPETCLAPPELDPANLYPKVLDRYNHFYPNKGVEEKDVYKKQCIVLKPDHRYLRQAVNTTFVAQTTARELDACQILDLQPHECICKYYGVETSNMLQFKYQNKTIELPMDRGRVLNLVFESLDDCVPTYLLPFSTCRVARLLYK